MDRERKWDEIGSFGLSLSLPLSSSSSSSYLVILVLFLLFSLTIKENFMQFSFEEMHIHGYFCSSEYFHVANLARIFLIFSPLFLD